ncbi:hypothetical protein [Solirubrobacter ginsenosidimutans]|uniref:hypothetical protein n=1 Tax=Solirubrobacter ginsenosidimutans TaxID=490573 RepID=UPI0022CDCCD7|nr:hypothetical protein [Solirubrobacter ginsenosidimutans]
MMLAGCGGDKDPPKVTAGKIVSGDTENGMKLKVETFVPAASDPTLKSLEAFRAKSGYPAVDYHRVTADNTKGAIPDRIRDVTFAKDANAIATGQGTEARFACDALQYEWPPVEPRTTTQTYDELMKKVCAIQPNKADSVAPGSRAVYYLVTDRSFGQRGIRGMSIFGPRSEQLK